MTTTDPHDHGVAGIADGVSGGVDRRRARLPGGDLVHSNVEPVERPQHPLDVSQPHNGLVGHKHRRTLGAAAGPVGEPVETRRASDHDRTRPITRIDEGAHGRRHYIAGRFGGLVAGWTERRGHC